ncbi:hypothetical protein AC579_6292 [Pseudocercospora musae]|uniref:Uncharacterized protein n=1 Tax=Pseudocercospora musae TaxID=113226 RepID=A0A139IP84_9PEZI|nr:hypothetical protein AC579_6292 [Pseudocercospora musae]
MKVTVQTYFLLTTTYASLIPHSAMARGDNSPLQAQRRYASRFFAVPWSFADATSSDGTKNSADSAPHGGRNKPIPFRMARIVVKLCRVRQHDRECNSRAPQAPSAPSVAKVYHITATASCRCASVVGRRDHRAGSAMCIVRATRRPRPTSWPTMAAVEDSIRNVTTHDLSEYDYVDI